MKWRPQNRIAWSLCIRMFTSDPLVLVVVPEDLQVVRIAHEVGIPVNYHCCHHCLTAGKYIRAV